MRVKNITREGIDKALAQVSGQYEGNVIYNRVPEKQGNFYRLTLRVKNSRGKGAKTGYTGRRTVSACWHVHGHFFEALIAQDENVDIRVGANTKIDKHGGNWVDRNIGSIMYPRFYSEACNCN